MLKFRGSLVRKCHSRGPVSPSCRQPFRVCGGVSPRKASAKEKSVIMIPRQNGYLKLREENTKREDKTIAPGIEE